MSANEIRDFNHFLLWEQASRDAILVKRVYIDMAGDVIAGLMLSQIIYWHLPSSEGKTRLRIVRDGYFWLAKSHTEWWDECRLTVDQARRALKILQDKGLVVTALKRFNGAPTVHIRLNQEFFLNELNRFGLQPKSIRDKTQIEMADNPNPFGLQPESYKQRLLTKTTTEITAADTASTELPKRRQVAKGTAAADSIVKKKRDSNPETLALIEALIAADVNPAEAEHLARTQPEEARRQLEFLPFMTERDSPGGWLASAIRGEFPAPKGYKVAKAKEERERKKRIEAEQKQAQEAAQQAAEEAEALRVDDSIARLEIEAPGAFTAFSVYVETERRKVEAKYGGMKESIRVRMLQNFDTPLKRRELFVAWQALPESERMQFTPEPQEPVLFRYEADKHQANGHVRSLANPDEAEQETDPATIAALVQSSLGITKG